MSYESFIIPTIILIYLVARFTKHLKKLGWEDRMGWIIIVLDLVGIFLHAIWLVYVVAILYFGSIIWFEVNPPQKKTIKHEHF